jgi:hypothetical protein
MLPITSPVWTHAPELRYVQFPWRWLLVLDVPFALGVATAMVGLSRKLKRASWAIALLALALMGFLLTRSNWWDAGGADDFFETHFSTAAGYLGADEYGPRGSDHYDLKQGLPLVGLRMRQNASSQSTVQVEVLRWGPVRKEFVVHSAAPVTAALRLDSYPAWRVEVNGNSAHASSESSGQMLVSLPAGSSRVRISFATTPDRLWGDIISGLAALGVLAALLARQRSRTTGATAAASFTSR